MVPQQVSLYIHIPFCKSKCRYCDFYSIRYDRDLTDCYIDSLVTEWDLVTRSRKWSEIPVGTVFFGGGTPSILSIEQWRKLGRFINGLNLSADLEWTVECNPESFSPEKAELWSSIGVTRLTFGIQSLSPDELALAGRVHSPQRAIEVLNDPVLQKFKSVGVDIIYGLPLQTSETLCNTVQNTVDNPYVKHCSVYELTLSEDTSFGRHRRILPLPEEDSVYGMSKMVFSVLEERGFLQYEISNFAEKGYRCKHNEVYWDHGDYIGLGAAAHSCVHPERWANISDVKKYMEDCRSGVLPVEFREVLSQDMIAEEMLFLGFRRLDGIDESRFLQKTGMHFADRVDMEIVDRFIAQKWLTYQKPWYRVTKEGLFFADKMARDLL